MRVFQNIPLQENTVIELDDSAAHHIARVMRATVGDALTIFNGKGGEFESVITRIDKKNVCVEIRKFISREAESSLEIYLAQGISRGEKMDFTIQKAVELGVKKIIPLFTERCNVKLDNERREKRLQHWQSVVISACEQSGRNFIPDVEMPQMFDVWSKNVNADFKFVLSPHVTEKLANVPIQKNSRVILLIGPEGGLNENEIHLARQQGFLFLNLGPRILRTETAALAAICALQCLVGDMSS